MSTITKEQLQQIEAAAKEALWPVVWSEKKARKHFNEKITPEVVLELARIALASLEAEAVSINDDMAYTFHHALSDSSLGADEVEEIKAGLRAAFANVTAPPAPVSDSLLSELLDIAKRAADEADECAHAEFSDDSMEHSAAIADWELRAAMLQGAENGESATTMKTAPAVDSSPKIDESPSGNSPVIPGGWVMVPVEPTYQMCKAMGLPWESPRFPDLYKAMLAAVKK